MSLSYKITNLQNPDGNTEVTITIDGVDYPQRIADVPVDDSKQTVAFLTDYAKAFKAGKDLEALTTPDPTIQINLVQNIE